MDKETADASDIVHSVRRLANADDLHPVDHFGIINHQSRSKGLEPTSRLFSPGGTYLLLPSFTSSFRHSFFFSISPSLSLNTNQHDDILCICISGHLAHIIPPTRRSSEYTILDHPSNQFTAPQSTRYEECLLYLQSQAKPITTHRIIVAAVDRLVSSTLRPPCSSRQRAILRLQTCRLQRPQDQAKAKWFPASRVRRRTRPFSTILLPLCQHQPVAFPTPIVHLMAHQ